MSKKKESTALTLPERAKAAIAYDGEQELAKKAKESKHITTITNTEGRDQVHGMRMVLKNARLEIEKRGKAARADARAFGDAVIAEEKRLIALIEPEEARLAAIQKTWDDRIEAERQAKVRAEQERQAAIQKRIQWMRDAIPHAVAATASEGLAKLMAAVDGVVIDDTFEEAKDTAADVKAEVYAQLAKMHEAFVAREAESARLAAERAEFDRQRQEQVARDKVERDRIAAERKAFEEEQAAARETQRKERERIAAEQAAESERIRKEGEALAAAQRAEQERKDREETERKEAEARAQREREALEAAAAAEAERQRKANFVPTLEQVVEVLADHFEVTNDRVLEWFADDCLNLRLARSKAA